jgi:hypothetical protein
VEKNEKHIFVTLLSIVPRELNQAILYTSIKSHSGTFSDHNDIQIRRFYADHLQVRITICFYISCYHFTMYRNICLTQTNIYMLEDLIYIHTRREKDHNHIEW